MNEIQLSYTEAVARVVTEKLLRASIPDVLTFMTLTGDETCDLDIKIDGEVIVSLVYCKMAPYEYFVLTSAEFDEAAKESEENVGG